MSLASLPSLSLSPQAKNSAPFTCICCSPHSQAETWNVRMIKGQDGKLATEATTSCWKRFLCCCCNWCCSPKKTAQQENEEAIKAFKKSITTTWGESVVNKALDKAKKYHGIDLEEKLKKGEPLYQNEFSTITGLLKEEADTASTSSSTTASHVVSIPAMIAAALTSNSSALASDRVSSSSSSSSSSDRSSAETTPPSPFVSVSVHTLFSSPATDIPFQQKQSPSSSSSSSLTLAMLPEAVASSSQLEFSQHKITSLDSTEIYERGAREGELIRVDAQMIRRYLTNEIAQTPNIFTESEIEKIIQGIKRSLACQKPEIVAVSQEQIIKAIRYELMLKGVVVHKSPKSIEDFSEEQLQNMLDILEKKPKVSAPLSARTLALPPPSVEMIASARGVTSERGKRNSKA